MRNIPDSMIRGGGCVIALALAFGCSPGPSRGSAGQDAAIGDDAALDAGPLDEGGPTEVDGGEGGGCQPTGIAGYQPPAALPMGARSTACNGFNGDGGLVETFRDVCLQHTAASPACASLLADAGAGADCLNCLISQPTPDQTYSSATAELESVPVVNFSLCIQLVDPSDAGVACAHLIQQTVACNIYTCQACPITDETTIDTFTACANASNVDGCVGYAYLVNACLADETGDGGTPVAQICFPGSTPQEKFISFAHYLCGGD